MECPDQAERGEGGRPPSPCWIHRQVAPSSMALESVAIWAQAALSLLRVYAPFEHATAQA
eukprot:1010700-Pyramimonas_sp.AAC.1